MPHEMLALGASALGVAAIVLVLLSGWAHRRVRTGGPTQIVAVVAKRAKAAWTLKVRGPTSGVQGHAVEGGKLGRAGAVPVGPSGSSAAFRHPARNTAVKEVINRSLMIHFFNLHKGTRDPVHRK